MGKKKLWKIHIKWRTEKNVCFVHEGKQQQQKKKVAWKMKWKCFSIVTKWKFVWFYGFVWEWANDLWVSLGSFWICGCGWVKPFDLFLGSAMETIFESFAAVAENTFNRKTTWKMSQIITQHIKPYFFDWHD